MENKETKIIILYSSLLIFIIIIGFLAGRSVSISEPEIEIESDQFSKIQSLNTEDLHKLLIETSITTEINKQAYRELDKRGYFEERRNLKEIEAQKLLNELTQ